VTESKPSPPAGASSPGERCLSVDAVLDLLEGRLDAKARLAVLEHLDHCEDCHALVAQASGKTPVRIEEETFLLPGETVGRYGVVEKLGAGAMGVVYAAQDAELGRKVALKVLRSAGKGPDEALRMRLMREAQAIALLSHPNVVSVFDVGTHQGHVFFTMEYVEGQTLSAWLAHGRRRWPEVVRVFRQAGEGLAAAHAKGLVHRDFKPDNVLVGADGRVRVTDFGLARAAGTIPAFARDSPSPKGFDDVLTRTGALLGTPAYMSPEQISGAPVDAKSDQFGFCVALYEALYGERPFPSEDLAALEKAIAVGAVKPPRRAEGVPRWLRRTVLRGLRAHPSERWPDLPALLHELDRGLRRNPRRAVAVAFGLVALIGVAVAVVGASRIRVAAVSTAPVPAARTSGRPALALLGFQNLEAKPDKAWLSSALTEMLRSEFSASRKLRVIGGDEIARVLLEQTVQPGKLDDQARARLAANLGVAYLVWGSYLTLPKNGVRLDFRLANVSSPDAVLVFAELGNEGNLPDLVSRVAARAREKLDAGELSATETRIVRQAHPATPEAQRLYAEGLERLRLFDDAAARDTLQRAVDADPSYPLSHAALGQAWKELGYGAQAKEEAKKALDLGQGLRREDILRLEGQYREVTEDWPKAEEIYRTLFALYPDDLDHGLRLAKAQAFASHLKQAEATLETLRRLPDPSGGSPLIDLVEAEVLNSNGDYATLAKIAEQARSKGESRGARLLAARALGWEAMAAYNLGDYTRAIDLGNSAASTLQAAGDDREAADAEVNVIASLIRRGSLAEATRLAERVLSRVRSIEYSTGVANLLSVLTHLLFSSGELAKARERSEETQTFLEGFSGDDGMMVEARTEEGIILLAQGDPSAAAKILDPTLEMARTVGDLRLEAWTESNIGDLLLVEGRLNEAESTLNRALALRDKLGLRQFAAETRRSLAALCLKKGRPREAWDLAQKAFDEFQAQDARDDEAEALVLRAQAERDLSRMPEALASVQSAEKLVAASEQPAARMMVAIAASPIRAATCEAGSVEQARRDLNGALGTAEDHGFRVLALEDRLAAAGIESRCGGPGANRSVLNALAREADASGLGLISREARLLMK
jgi:eukaryotic-like serine/threonine-protein kinase